ncbi:pentatricopeptide repeat-containing protein At5g55740, chloroplastic [Impatiens glandulifera]|uniref:pentatricopeptide repeat-containing protein At5g55740, chloroplastic n=1 Tax=Impatiens glandulifera TaxID=253017 RepID=UPI001FB053C5|nr:pentatricopeptide repeat-containing protein At5g55740, chloroplastic [Impatiens glandulifera]
MASLFLQPPKNLANTPHFKFLNKEDGRFPSRHHHRLSYLQQISSISKDCRLHEAVDLFTEMQDKEINIGPEIYGDLIQACHYDRNLFTGRQFHALIIKHGDELGKNEYIETKLLIFYAKCDLPEVSIRAFERMQQRSVYSWAAIIGLYCRLGLNEEALMGFIQMLESGILADNFVMPNALKACGALGRIGLGKGVHGYSLKTGFGDCVFLASSLVDMYGKCCVLHDARKVFDFMPERNVVSWNSMITSYVQNGMNEEALKLFYEMRMEGIHISSITIVSFLSACANLIALEEGKQGHAIAIVCGLDLDNNILGSSILNFYSKVKSIEEAELVFNRIHDKDVVTWNLLTSCYANCGLIDKAVSLCRLMRSENYIFDAVTLSSIISSAADAKNLKLGKECHCYCLRNDLVSNVIVINTVVNMYAKCGRIIEARRVFNSSRLKDLALWNTLMAAYSELGLSGETLKLFYDMQLDGIPPNVVSFNSILIGFLRKGQVDEVIIFFRQMLEMGIRPNSLSITAILSACTDISSLILGRSIHGYLTRRNCLQLIPITTALLDMYGKCGKVKQAEGLFGLISNKETPIYNAMISAYAVQGRYLDAINMLKKLEEEGKEPDGITFTCILSACSHSGLLNEGVRVFIDMVEKYRIKPRMEHYGCMVSLFSRLGYLEEALDIIRSMPFSPDAQILSSLLAGTKEEGKIETGEYISEFLFEIESTSCGNYVALSNAYAGIGRFDEASRVRRMMREKSVKKNPGCSWIQIGGNSRVFVSGYDASYPEADEIYSTLDLLLQEMRDCE